MEPLTIRSFKKDGTKPTFNWNLKCTFTACEDEEGVCQLDPQCQGRYDNLKSDQNRKKRSGEQNDAPSYTMETVIDHPCNYVDDQTTICDGVGENCWTNTKCGRSSASATVFSFVLYTLAYLVK